MPGQPAEQRRAFSAWDHLLGARLSSSTSQRGIQAVSSLSPGIFFPFWDHNNNLGKSGASESRVLSSPCCGSMVWAVTYLIPSSLCFSCHGQWVTQRGLRVVSKERKLCHQWFSVHYFLFHPWSPKARMSCGNGGGRVPLVENKAPWHMYCKRRSSSKMKAQSRRAHGACV